MLQDAIWADGERLADDPEYKDIATRFVAASIQGWAFCRDDPEACRDIVVAAGSSLGNSHQLWQMNAVNQLIWPSPLGIGMMDEAAWERTVDIAQSTPNLEGTTVLTAPPDDGAYTTAIVEAAHALLGDSVDLMGHDYEAIEVTLEPAASRLPRSRPVLANRPDRAGSRGQLAGARPGPGGRRRRARRTAPAWRPAR